MKEMEDYPSDYITLNTLFIGIETDILEEKQLELLYANELEKFREICTDPEKHSLLNLEQKLDTIKRLDDLNNKIIMFWAKETLNYLLESRH